METANNIRKQTKFFISIMKEKLWLEQMALEGWVLTNLVGGVRYTFEKSEPKRLIYEIDRFNLSKNPSLKEINHKEEFIAVAVEMGWNPIIHDEDQNHYFCKEYVEGEINELYNDHESRKYRAKKYYNRYKELQTTMLSLAFAMAIFGLAIAITEKLSSSMITGFIIFLFGYQVFSIGFGILCGKLAQSLYDDLILTIDEWNTKNGDCTNSKTVRKLKLTNDKVCKYLTMESEEGWHVDTMSSQKFTFKSGNPGKYVYTIDSKYLTNRRLKAKGVDKLKDNKDWLGLNNDWQVTSLNDAKSKKWEYVCAVENQAILYRSQENMIPEALNEKRYDKMLRWKTLVGEYGICFFVGALIGLIIGIVQVIR